MNRIFSDRRILTFPAIHPCSTVSPAALLSDLSHIAADIAAAGSRQSDRFRTSRRAARDAVRYAGVLLAFLEDLRYCAIPPAAILSLSDLHVTLQKLRLLLADCARDGARVWILMNAERVAGEFRVLLRAMAPALEVLPIDSMDVSEEVRDVVGFLAGQARRVEVGVEAADDLAARSVRSMVAQFDSGESPDSGDLRRVLDHLKMTSWRDCFAEVCFLEEEIFAEEGEGEESAVLWSLMGLMIYSMGALIESSTASGKRRSLDDGERTTTTKGVNLEGFRCPISLELMKDPVTVSTGQTYERSSILRWLKSGKRTCPITGERLAGDILIPNCSVRKLLTENGVPIPRQEKTKTRSKELSKTLLSPASPAAVGAIRMASTVIVGKLASGGPELKNVAAYMIRTLSKSNSFNRMCFVEGGAVQWLLCLVPSSEHCLQENAVAALLNLSKHHSGRADILESAGLHPLVEAMRFGHTVDARQNAAAILFYLAAMDDCRKLIGDTRDAIPALVDLLNNGTYRGRKNAVVTIYGLLLFPGNQPKVLAAGIVAVIDELLVAEEEDLVADCVGVLAKIAERQDGANAILRSRAVVGQLVHLLRASSSHSAREYCASTLLSLCRNGGEKALVVLENTPVLMPSLYSLLSDGSRQASKKARSLLNYIHEFTDQRYSQSFPPPPPPPPESVVHAL